MENKHNFIKWSKNTRDTKAKLLNLLRRDNAQS